jgi:hypothetical protein
MADTVVETLILDLLEWLAKRERSYEEVMDAWRTSCPRLPVWEDANDRGLVMRMEVNGRLHCLFGRVLFARSSWSGMLQDHASDARCSWSAIICARHFVFIRHPWISADVPRI